MYSQSIAVCVWTTHSNGLPGYTDHTLSFPAPMNIIYLANIQRVFSTSNRSQICCVPVLSSQVIVLSVAMTSTSKSELLLLPVSMPEDLEAILQLNYLAFAEHDPMILAFYPQ